MCSVKGSRGTTGVRLPEVWPWPDRRTDQNLHPTRGYRRPGNQPSQEAVQGYSHFHPTLPSQPTLHHEGILKDHRCQPPQEAVEGTPRDVGIVVHVQVELCGQEERETERRKKT